MAGVDIGFELSGDRALNDFLDLLITRAKSPKKFYDRVGKKLLASTQDRYLVEKDPKGNKWKSLSPSYKNSAKKRNSAYPDSILLLTGDMFKSLDYEANFDGLSIGSDVVYAATHQYGDDSRNIPARPFLGISDADERIIYTEMFDFLQGN